MVVRRAEIEGLDEMLRMLNRAPTELKKELRTAAKNVAEPVAKDASRRAARGSRQLAAIAPTYKAKMDRIPSVQAGGAKRVTSSGAKAYQIMYGAEFGSNTMKRFPSRKKEGRAMYPAIIAARKLIADEYLDAVQGVFRG